MRWQIYLLLALAMTLSSCTSATQPDSRAQTETTSEESEAVIAPKREIISSYENLQGKTAEPAYQCKVVNTRNIQPEKAVETVSRAIPNIIAVKGEGTNSIVLRGEKYDIEQAEKIILSIDKKTPQILIEGKVVEVSQSGLSDIGIIWGKEQGSFKFSIDKNSGAVSQSDNILGTINALIASGNAKLLASPKISALDGKEAEINIGSRIPYAVPAGTTSASSQWTIQYIDAGVNLRILPSVASDGTIVSTIKPEVSNISEWRTTSAGEFPVISTRNASVTVRMKDGETLIIGGLLNESDRENISGIAGLSELPLIGQVFQRKVIERTRTDVLFLITPHLML